MRDSPAPLFFALLCFAVSGSFVNVGCSRTKYRLEADRDAYGAIEERNGDSRWSSPEYSIEQDPRSRYFDAYDPDHSPMPPDDPSSHEYMRLVDGKKGWKHWHDNGDRVELENPAWREVLGEYVEVGDDGAIKLNVDSALRLAYVHSPAHQRQLETLYLASLDVAAERFRLDTQFFGGHDVLYNHNGALVPASLSYDAGLGKYVISPPAISEARENNRVTLSTDLQAGGPTAGSRRKFATAGELLIGFANSFVFEFTGGDANLTASLANFSFIQPLLRGAGRDIALEQLTLDERNLLANLRAYSQYRQGFYTQVAIGELGVTGTQRSGATTTLQSFSGAGGVNGYLGLLQQRQQLRNSADNLNLQLRTFDRLNALYNNELIDLVQVDQFRQSIEAQRDELLGRINGLELALDNYKTGTLGLPANLPVDLDETLIRQFQLFPREAGSILDSLFELQARIGDVGELLDLTSRSALLQDELSTLPNDATIQDIDRILRQTLSVVEAVELRTDDLPSDLATLELADDSGALELTDAQSQLIQLLKERLRDGPESVQQELLDATETLEQLQDLVSAENVGTIVSEKAGWLREILTLSQACILVQSRARHVALEPEQILMDASEFIEPVRQLFESAREELARMDEFAPLRERNMIKKDVELFRRDRRRLHQRLVDLEQGKELGFEVSAATLEALRDGFSPDARVKTVRGLTAWVQAFIPVVERLSLIPAQARLEIITVEPISLNAEDAFQIALTHRLDFMNGRAALVDRWRQIQVNADALQSILNVTASGDVRTARNNPVDFRAPTGSFRMGLEFDAPFTRLLERNAYRESLIEYQRNRRAFIQSRDSLEKGLRALIRNLEQSRQQLDIQRRAVSIAMRRVDQTQLSLNTPPPQLQPGARGQINPTTAINLLSAQSSLQNTQNSLLTAWLRYYAERLRLYRELGIMQLDHEGRWMEYPIGGSTDDAVLPGNEPPLEELPLPPLVPASWIEAVDSLEQYSENSPTFVVGRVSHTAAVPSTGFRRLPPTNAAGGTNGYKSPQDR